MSDLFSDCDMLVEEFEHQPDPATVDESTTSNVRTSSSSGALPLSDTSHSNEVVSVRNAHPPFLEQDLIHPRASDVALDPMSLSSHPAEHLNMNIAGPRDRPWVISRIERLVIQQLDALTSGGDHVKLILRTRTPTRGNDGNSTTTPKAGTVRTLRFPGASSREAWRYTVLLRLFEMIHEALVNGVTVSKRDIYYRDPALFSSQAIVDRYVDDIAYAFGVPRSMLNVTATAKGLVAGAISFSKADGTYLQASSDPEGILISELHENDTVYIGKAKWVLIVEKEATFRALASTPFWNTLVKDGILITAKGYPDVATRSLLQLLATPSPRNGMHSCPIHALVDFDPDGLDIMSTYKYSFLSLSDQNPIRWLGLNSTNLVQDDTVHQTQGLLRLSARDRHKASRMLEREPYVEHGKEPEWRREIQIMLMLNIKAEIQLLEAKEGGLPRWVSSRLA